MHGGKSVRLLLAFAFHLQLTRMRIEVPLLLVSMQVCSYQVNPLSVIDRVSQHLIGNIFSEPLVNYKGNGEIIRETSIFKMMVNHIVSIVGWGMDPETGGTCELASHG
jgi:hypothetical protein